MNIFESLNLNKFSYKKLIEKSIIEVQHDECDLNIIVGFRGRENFIQPLIKSFKEAMLDCSTKFDGIQITFVEHDIEPLNRELIINHGCNYIWTPGNVVDQYSRSLAFNFGFIHTSKSKFYLFHDVDILVKKNFFEELSMNISNETKCLQTYGERRVLYMDNQLTTNIIDGVSNLNDLSVGSPGVSLPMFGGQLALGSKGGSILVERDFFIEIGGFDPELFWGYAAEDQIFWDKAITLLGEVQYADNPCIDMFHMWHPPSSSSNPLLHEMENYMLQFRSMSKKDRMKFLQIKKQLLTNE